MIREKKKEQVKQYLKELKDIVSKQGSKSRMIGSVSTLQHVVNSFKKIRGKSCMIWTVSTLQHVVNSLKKSEVQHFFYTIILFIRLSV